MSIKTNYITPILVIGFIIVVIANHFYDPFGTLFGPNDPWAGFLDGEITATEGKVLNSVLSFAFPVIPALSEVTTYLQFNREVLISHENLAALLIFLLYSILLFTIERFHSELHEDEDIFTICINMICVEKIVMYIFSIISAFIYVVITSLQISPVLLWILTGILILPALCALLIQFVYWCIAALIILLPSVLIIDHLPTMNIAILNVITLLLLIFFAQVVWRSISDTVLKKVCYCCSLGRIDLE